MENLVLNYVERTNGRFIGILRWPQFDALWQALSENSEDWYVYEPEKEGPPSKPLSSQQMKAFLTSTDTYLRELCTPERCGAVYADNIANPDFVKIYNPRLMGGCGMGKAPLPQWLISRMKPVSLIEEPLK